MEFTKDQIRAWVDSPQRGYEWLAQQCGKTEKTVKNWLAGDFVIPASGLRTIESLMRADRAREDASNPSMSHLIIRVNVSEFESWEQTALNHHKTVTNWAIDAIRQAYEAEMANKDQSSIISFPLAKKKAHLMAAAGSPLGAEVQDWHGADDTVLVQLSGLSMEPKFHDGDILTLKHRRASRNEYMKKGCFYMVEYKDGYTFKRYNTRKATKEEIEKGISYTSPEDGKQKVRVLESLNKDYPEIIIEDDAKWIAWLPEK